MELRLSGTREECAQAEAAIRRAFPEAIESVSAYYPNRRPGQAGTGRVYIDMRMGP